MKIITIALSALTLSLSFATGLNARVIYGTDHRYEDDEVSPFLKKLSLSTAAQMSTVLVARNASIVTLYGMALSETPILDGGLKISKSIIGVNHEVTMLGHPTGLPIKITTNGKIKGLEKNRYVSNLDAFGGNSGPAVIDSKTGEVIGILAAGQEDYVPDLKDYCARPKKSENGRFFGIHKLH
jgi:hypothetical protein